MPNYFSPRHRRYELEGLGNESRWGEIFRTRPDLPCPPPAPCTMDIRSLSRGLKPGRGVGYPHFLTQVKERVQLYSTPLLGLRNLLYGEFYLYLHHTIPI